ncbi:MAG: cytochrome c biogenesis protein ResB [bacterium]|nr:cytochrome c biogenesis protein ResB [bacterium]
MLSTMKFAIWILILLGVLSLASLFSDELISQEWLNSEPEGGLDSVWRSLYYLLQMDDPFRSWWYRGLIGVLSLSLFACILERTPIVWRMWSKRPLADTTWATEQTVPIILTTAEPVASLRERLSHKFGWRLQTEEVWVGESGRLALWGPLLTHLGLLLLALGGLVGSFGDTEVRNGGYAGDTIEVDGMPFQVRIDSFRVEFYPLQPQQWVLVDGEWIGRLIKKDSEGSWKIERRNDSGEVEYVSMEEEWISNDWDLRSAGGNVKQYISSVSVIEGDEIVDQREISVNTPLRRSGYRLYQSSFDPESPRVRASYDVVTLHLTDSTGSIVHQTQLGQGDSYQVPGDSIKLTAGRLLPDFKLDSRRKAYSASANFANPALELIASGPTGFEKTMWSFLAMEGHSTRYGIYSFKVAGLQNESAQMDIATIFDIRHSPGTEFLWFGFAVSSIGLILCFYVTHRVIYVEAPVPNRSLTRVIGVSKKMTRIFEHDLSTIAKQSGHEITMIVKPEIDHY